MAGQPTALVSASAEGRAQTEPRRGQIDAFYPAVRTWREFNSGPPILFVGNFFPPRRSDGAQGERRSDGSVTRTMRTHPLAPEQTELRHSVHVLKVVGDFRAISKEASMARTLSISITRRSIVAGLAMTAVPLSLARTDKAYAQDKKSV